MFPTLHKWVDGDTIRGGRNVRKEFLLMLMESQGCQ